MGKMVTRTINETEVVFDVVDLSTMKILETSLLIAGKMEGKKLEKEVEKRIPKEVKFISIKNTNYSEKLYGMEEQQFLELAQELPPRKKYDKGGEE